MKPKILLLADTGHQAAAVQDHIRAVIADTRYQWDIENPLVCKMIHKQNLDAYSAIGIHYSIKAHSSYYLPNTLFKALQKYNGFKFIFLQDEYRCVNTNIQAILSLQIHTLFTLLEETHHELAYAELLKNKVKLIQVLTGYVDLSLKNYPSQLPHERTTDIFYRSRHYPYWLGSLAQERTIIANKFIEKAPSHGLNINISLDENKRIYGHDWLQALASSKAVLGTESGASIWDVDGEIERKTKLFIGKNPAASFDKVFEEILSPHEGNILYAAISPRIFEAAATKTAMILFHGKYNGILKPHEHYIPLEKNFSNLNTIFKKLQDSAYLQTLTTNCYNDLIASSTYDYQRLGEIVANAIQSHLKSCPKDTARNAELIYIKQPYGFINHCFIFISECKFMLIQFFKLLTDPSYKGVNKYKALHSGLKRYLSYISARFKKVKH